MLAIDALVMSRINYCSAIWSKTSKEQLNSVQKCLNFAAKVACDGKYTKRDHVTPLMKDLKWLNIQYRLQLNEASYLQKQTKISQILNLNIFSKTRKLNLAQQLQDMTISKSNFETQNLEQELFK